MSKFNNPLDRVTIAAPCPANWDKMVGDARVRFCGSCEMNVYNLSGMSKRDAETLLREAESMNARVCVRFYRRADGTILTENCPVGLRLLKRRVTQAASALLSAVVSFAAGLGVSAWSKEQGATLTESRPLIGSLVAVEKPSQENSTNRKPMLTEDYIVGQPVAGRVVFTPQASVHRNSPKRIRRSR